MAPAGTRRTAPHVERHLIWTQRGYTDRQLWIIQVVVLGEALSRAAEAIREPTDEQKKHMTEIILYMKSGLALLEKILKELGDVKDNEMRFRLLEVSGASLGR